MSRKKHNPAPLVPPSIPKLTDPADDPHPVRALLNAEKSATDWALAMYAQGPRNEPITLVPGQTLKAGPLHDMFFTRGLALRRLREAARTVEAHNFGPRAPLADVQHYVRRLERVCGHILTWALQYRGRQPPPWEPPPDTASPEEVMEALARLPDCRSPEARPERERDELWRELEAARDDLLLLQTLKPTAQVMVDVASCAGGRLAASTPGENLATTQEATDFVTSSPRWDREKKTLWLGFYRERIYGRVAPNQFQVLDAFEAQGWPTTIESPLDNKCKVKDTVEDLNYGLGASRLKFHREDGDESIRWSYTSV